MKSIPPRVVNGVSIVRLGRTDWRVCATANPDQPLGYIERQRGDRFEVVWMSDPMRWGYAESFDEALLAFGDSARFTGEILERRASVVGRQRNAAAPAHRTTWLKPHRRSGVA